MEIRTVLAGVSALALAACGADDVAAPTSDTSQAPAPTPTASPIPTPAYVAFNDLTGEHSFDMACTNANQLLPYGRAVPIDYRVETGIWRTGDNGADPAIAYGPQDIVDNRPGELTRYVIDRRNASIQLLNGLTIIVPQSSAGSHAEYVRALNFDLLDPGTRREVLNHRQSCVFGVPTEVNDLAIASPNSYAKRLYRSGWGELANGTVFDLSESEVTATYYPTDRQLDLTVTIRGRERDEGTVIGAGTLSEGVTSFGTFSGTARIGDAGLGYIGTLTSANGEEVGGFAGWFFGPEASEIGLVLSFAIAADGEASEAPDENVFAVLIAGQRD